MNKRFLLATVSLFSAVTLAACSSAPTGSSNSSGTKVGDTIKVGINLELTGAVSAYGNAEKNGAQLAINEINKDGGVNGKN